MAVLKPVPDHSCSECGAKVSLRSTHCPLCGADVPAQATKRPAGVPVEEYQDNVRQLRDELIRLRGESKRAG